MVHKNVIMTYQFLKPENIQKQKSKQTKNKTKTCLHKSTFICSVSFGTVCSALDCVCTCVCVCDGGWFLGLFWKRHLSLNLLGQWAPVSTCLFPYLQVLGLRGVCCHAQRPDGCRDSIQDSGLMQQALIHWPSSWCSESGLQAHFSASLVGGAEKGNGCRSEIIF